MQEPQFPPSESESLTPAERRAVKRARTRRLQALTLGVGAGVLALFVVGCPQPADLANPQDYPLGGTTSGGTSNAGTGTGGAAPASCETECVKDIFQKQATLCKICHGAKPAPDGLQYSGLNLEGDDFTSRLRDVAAKHGDLPTGKADCGAGDLLINTANPSASWLLKKIHGDQGDCGDPMPSTMPLTTAQKTCVETYVACVAPGGSTPTGGTSSGGTASGGSSSGGTASGGAAAAGTSTGGTGGAKGGSGGTGGA